MKHEVYSHFYEFNTGQFSQLTKYVFAVKIKLFSYGIKLLTFTIHLGTILKYLSISMFCYFKVLLLYTYIIHLVTSCFADSDYSGFIGL